MMTSSPLIDSDRIETLKTRISHKVQTSHDQIIPFADNTEFLTDLLRVADSGNARLFVGGLATAEVSLAADRAGLKPIEIVGRTPFAGHPDQIAERLDRTDDIVLLTNPNRLSGANFGLTDIEIIAQRVPDGLVIVDEHYFDFYGITAVKLLGKYSNLAVLRSLTGGFGINSDRSGFAVVSARWIEKLKQFHDWDKISFTLYKILITSLSSSEVLSYRLKTIHDESLRICQKLNSLRIQCRLSATDFILMRVADPIEVVKFLETYQVKANGLNHYAGLEQYVRYRIQSPVNNDSFIRAMIRMPESYYQITGSRQTIKLKRPGESVQQERVEVATVRREHVSITREELPA